MNSRFLSHRLLDAASVLALTAVATVGPAAFQPAAAVQGVYAGGATLVSLVMRQIFDCYHGSTLPGDGYAISPLFNHLTPTPGLLPTSCTTGALPTVTGLYAAVGSGSGLRAFSANSRFQLLRSALKPPTVPAPPPFRLPLPAVPPVFVDGTNVAPFGTYPYPRIDIGASEAPLKTGGASVLTTSSYSSFTPATNWQALLPSNTPVQAAFSSTVTYSTAKYGQPIQIPALEVPVAVAINVAPTSAATWTIRSALVPKTKPGGAIQLSTAQLCAIFSARVRTWNSTALIVERNRLGAFVTRRFDADNTNATLHTPLPYTNTALPISVSYRSDEGGTTFVFTNYLATTCPLLDNGTNNYTKIFTGVGRTAGATANLPSTSFDTLVDNIKIVTGVDVKVDTSPIGSNAWIGGSGNLAVVTNIGNDAAKSGRIGYASADFVKPYFGATFAPLTASVLNEHLRSNGVYHPGDKGLFATAQNFIPPTPDNVSNAWKELKAPVASATVTYNDWNIYNQVFFAGTTVGGVNVSGKSRLPLSRYVNAYPVSGTSFLLLYSCYKDLAGPPNRVAALTNFLAWYIGGSDSSLPVGDPNNTIATFPRYDRHVSGILRNNGFHELPATFSKAIIAQYINPNVVATRAITAFKTTGAQVEGCIGVTGGGAAN